MRAQKRIKSKRKCLVGNVVVVGVVLVVVVVVPFCFSCGLYVLTALSDF